MSIQLTKSIETEKQLLNQMIKALAKVDDRKFVIEQALNNIATIRYSRDLTETEKTEFIERFRALI
jgi:hypothetical protein